MRKRLATDVSGVRGKPRVLAAILVALAAASSLTGCGHHADAASKPSASPTPAPFVPTAEVNAIASALTSGQARQLNQFLTQAQLREQRLGTDATPLLPAGAHITIGPGKPTRTGQIARVPITVTEAPTTKTPATSLNGQWMLVLLNTSGSQGTQDQADAWKLVGITQR
jgi:hypothetical protein